MHAKLERKGVKTRIALLVPALLSACASNYLYKEADNTAYLHMAGNSEKIFVEAYDTANCKLSENGTRLATFFGLTKNVENHETGVTKPIQSGKPFIFTYHYIDSRFGQNRTCSATVSFLPERGKKYNSYFRVKPEVATCEASVSDPNAKPGDNVSSFKYNENLCLSGSNQGSVNPQAVWINWTLK